MRNVEFLRLQNRISWKHFKLLNTQTYLETKTNNAFSIYGMDIQNGDLKKKPSFIAGMIKKYVMK